MPDNSNESSPAFIGQFSTTFLLNNIQWKCQSVIWAALLATLNRISLLCDLYTQWPEEKNPAYPSLSDGCLIFRCIWAKFGLFSCMFSLVVQICCWFSCISLWVLSYIYLLLLLLFWDKVMLCSACWPWACLSSSGWSQTHANPPASPSQVLRLHTCTTMPGLYLFDADNSIKNIFTIYFYFIMYFYGSLKALAKYCLFQYRNWIEIYSNFHLVIRPHIDNVNIHQWLIALNWNKLICGSTVFNSAGLIWNLLVHMK